MKRTALTASLLTFVTALTLGALIFTGCQKKNTQAKAPEEQLPERAQKLVHIDDETRSYLSEKHICVVLGYGYNDAVFIERIRELLDRDYGVESEEADGLIQIYVYPDDFEVSGRTRISKLASILEGQELAGILILGAPEGMNIPLSKMQDANGGTLPYPVFTLFPQDEVLASEATADFVLDYASAGENTALQEEVQVTQDFDIETLVFNSIQEMISLRGPVPADSSLLNFVQNIVGNQRTISHYTDAESGIQAANHFIFQ
ncbi:MAG: hypothetical protein K6G80_09425 [Treponema sp.]|nr:hypothetical protein [Treponema sp.]